MTTTVSTFQLLPSPYQKGWWLCRSFGCLPFLPPSDIRIGGLLRMPWTELYSAKAHIRRNWKQHLISNNASKALLFPEWRGDVTRTVIVRAQNRRVTLSCRGSKHRNTLQPLNSRFIFFSFLYKYPVQINSISSSSSLIPSYRTSRWSLLHFWSTWRGKKKFYNTQWSTSVGS